MEACCEPPCARVISCASVVLEAGFPDPASSCLSSYQPPPVCPDYCRNGNRPWVERCEYGTPCSVCPECSTSPPPPPCLASIDRSGGPRHLLGRPFGDQVVPLPCAAIRAAAALPTAIPSFSETLDAASLCDTAYARAENDGEFGPCRWVVGECRNAREMFC